MSNHSRSILKRTAAAVSAAIFALSAAAYPAFAEENNPGVQTLNAGASGLIDSIDSLKLDFFGSYGSAYYNSYDNFDVYDDYDGYGYSGGRDDKMENDGGRDLNYPHLDSKITAGATLSAEDAAMRLYYLGMLTGTGININGGVEFNLNGGLTRLEAAVLTVRMLGDEDFARQVKYPHPFDDVPSWASPYVGYLYSAGLLDDLCTLDSYTGHFNPNSAETAGRFLGYMLYALGYRTDDGDYTYDTAERQCSEIGIFNRDSDTLSADYYGSSSEKRDGEPMTRAGAITAIYNTLRTTMKNSGEVLSDSLVKKGSIEYDDAVFILWSDRPSETNSFIQASGYNTEWIIPDGYYTITSTVSGKVLNVASSGSNTDYEGVGVTMWENTNDVTQVFRIERTERGTYYIYSAASRSGYGRVIGADPDTTKTGLYGSTTSSAMEFYITGSADGSWRIVSAERENKCLSCADPGRDGAGIILADTATVQAQQWTFERQGVMNSYGRELALFVANSLVVTQGAFDTYSHMEQNALDIQPTEKAVRAPFNGTIVHIDANEIACNAVWLQSNDRVLYADGTYDYMTVCFMHDNDISDLSVGQGVAQGEYFYDSGDYGIAAGKHVHVAVYRGQFNEYAMHIGNGDCFAEDAFFLPDDIYIYNDYDLNWKRVSAAG